MLLFVGEVTGADTQSRWDTDDLRVVRFLMGVCDLRICFCLNLLPGTQAVLGRGRGNEIRRVHVERAKQLLASTELSTAIVAEQAGFSSQPQLSRVFRRETGLTPTAYRRQVRGLALD